MGDDLIPRVALVTGASRGLGRQIALALAEGGWKVALNYAHDDAGAARAADGIASHGYTAMPFKFDVTCEAEVEDGVAAIAGALGPVDLIVNNASGPQGAVPISDQNWALYQKHLEFFAKAPLLLLQAVLADWRRRRSGRIINIGTSAFDAGSPRDAHYVAAKGAMLGLTRSWASELGPEGITVNMISPCWTPVERHVGTDPAVYERFARQIPLRRMGQPQDLAAMVAFIASPHAGYVTGQNIRVNGGSHFR
jgi:3-oxoacyl-[acyl-carrier protein] reductase